MKKHHYWFFVAAFVIQAVLAAYVEFQALYDALVLGVDHGPPDLGVYIFGLVTVLAVYTFVGTKPP